jgi:hypothetical protein
MDLVLWLEIILTSISADSSPYLSAYLHLAVFGWIVYWHRSRGTEVFHTLPKGP